MLLLRYLDVCLVAAAAPLVLLGGLPSVGYLVGACTWLLTRAGAAFAYERAQRTPSGKAKGALLVAAMMGRVWLVAAGVIVARFAGSKDDGIMAAALVLAAFTVYFATSFVTRGAALQAGARAQGGSSAS